MSGLTFSMTRDACRWRAPAAAAQRALLLVGLFGCEVVDGRTDHTTQTEPIAIQVVHWPAGTAYRYALELSSESTFAKAPVGSWGYSVKADIELSPMKQGAGSIELHARVREPNVAPKGAKPAEPPAFADEIAAPFVLHLEQGRVVELRVADGMSAEAVAFLRTIAAGLQVPTEVRTEAATVHEHDATGEYEARYLLAGSKIERTKLRYLRLLSMGGALGKQVTPRVVQSKGTLRVADDGVIEAVSNDETLRSTLPAEGDISVRTVLTLKLLGREPVTSPPSSAPDGLVAVRADQPYGKAQDRTYFDDVRTEGMSLEDALEAVTKGADNGDGKTTEESLKAFSALAALIRKDPANVSAVMARARKEPGQTREMFDALSNAGSDEAQQALIDVIEDPESTLDERKKALWSLVRVKRPTAAQVSLLDTLVDDPTFAEFGVFGLGIAAKRLREASETERASAIRGRLSQLLAVASDDTTRVRALRGIANAGASELVDVVAPMVEQRSRNVREAAVAALGEMSTHKAEAPLVERLHSDKEASVRQAAAEALGRREPSTELGQALAQAALTDADRHVRHRALTAMTKWLDAQPGLRSTLEQIAKQDEEVRLREEASQALARNL